jgi:hypothetical protein
VSLSRRGFLGFGAILATAPRILAAPGAPPVKAEDVVSCLGVALFEDDPYAGGQEATFGGYQRVIVPRTAQNWQVKQGGGLIEVTNRCPIVFPTCNGGSSNISHFAIMDGKNIMWAGRLSSWLCVSTGITTMFGEYAINIVEG